MSMVTRALRKSGLLQSWNILLTRGQRHLLGRLERWHRHNRLMQWNARPETILRVPALAAGISLLSTEALTTVAAPPWLSILGWGLGVSTARRLKPAQLIIIMAMAPRIVVLRLAPAVVPSLLCLTSTVLRLLFLTQCPVWKANQGSLKYTLKTTHQRPKIGWKRASHQKLLPARALARILMRVQTGQEASKQQMGE